MQQPSELVIKRPDDWHLHLRDGNMLRTVLPFTAELYGRALVMPNIKPPLRHVRDIEAYRQRLMDALPPGHDFTPLMTLYLTDETDPSEIHTAKKEQLLTAVKLYPVGATTNSEHGVTDIRKTYPVLEAMQELEVPLAVHGEISDPGVDIFDRESVFIDRVLHPLRKDFPELKVILEHVSSKIGVDYVLAAEKKLGATITPHHLVINRNSIFSGGLNPHMYCLPVVKRETDRIAIRKAAVSGDSRFFFGSDSAPHLVTAKEKTGGAAGIFNIPTAIAHVAAVFDTEAALENLEAFMSLNGAVFYGMEPNEDTITMQKLEKMLPLIENIPVDKDVVKVFQTHDPVYWHVARGLRKTKA